MVRLRKEKKSRTRAIHIRLSDEEHKIISQKATAGGITISEFVRRTTRGRRITSKVEAHVVNELRRLGGLLKLVHVESGGAYSKDTAAAISDIRTAVIKLLGP